MPIPKKPSTPTNEEHVIDSSPEESSSNKSDAESVNYKNLSGFYDKNSALPPRNPKTGNIFVKGRTTLVGGNTIKRTFASTVQNLRPSWRGTCMRFMVRKVQLIVALDKTKDKDERQRTLALLRKKGNFRPN